MALPLSPPEIKEQCCRFLKIMQLQFRSVVRSRSWGLLSVLPSGPEDALQPEL